MADMNQPLHSLYDSLSALFSRLDGDDPKSLEVARIMLKIGQLISNDSQADDGAVTRCNDLAGEVSTVDPQDADAVSALLAAIEAFLGAL